MTMLVPRKQYSRPMPAPATLFLGAGASRAFGYPTTKEFLGLLLGRVGGKEKDLVQALVEVPEISDIEHVLEVLDQVTEVENPLLKFLDKRQVPLPVQPTYRSSGLSQWKEFKNVAASLRITIREELFKAYQFEPSKSNEIGSLLRGTLDFLTEESNLVHIFTTNYDSIIEQGLFGSNWMLVDGFLPSTMGGAQWGSGFPIAEESFSTPYPNTVYLYKLHGSLSWRLHKTTGKIVRIDSEEKASDYSRIFGNNILLYPASKQPPIIEPYGSLYDYFVRRLNSESICVVIGFSFRDPYINTEFVNYLRGSSNVVLIFSPNPDESKKNLLMGLHDDDIAARVIGFRSSYEDPVTKSLIGAQVTKYRSIISSESSKKNG